MSRWHLPSIADDLAGALQAAEAALCLEQATAGLDSRAEIALQEILAEGMRGRFEVAREVYYPSSLGRPGPERRRCDLVLSPPGFPVDSEEPGQCTLLASPTCAPEAALWLEVKAAYQFREGGAHRSHYGAQWRKAIVADLRKLAGEGRIRDAALVLVVFNQSSAILDQDLCLFELLLAAEVELLAGFRQARSFPIADRIGHSLCTVAIWPAFPGAIQPT